MPNWTTRMEADPAYVFHQELAARHGRRPVRNPKDWRAHVCRTLVSSLPEAHLMTKPAHIARETPMTAAEIQRRQTIFRDRTHPEYPQWAKDFDARVLAIEDATLAPLVRTLSELTPIHPTPERSFAMNNQSPSLAGAVKACTPTDTLMGELRLSQASTHELLAKLHSNLGPVLVPRPTCGETASAESIGPVRSPLCEELVQCVRRENDLHSRLNDILDSLSI